MKIGKKYYMALLNARDTAEAEAAKYRRIAAYRIQILTPDGTALIDVTVEQMAFITLYVGHDTDEYFTGPVRFNMLPPATPSMTSVIDYDVWLKDMYGGPVATDDVIKTGSDGPDRGKSWTCSDPACPCRNRICPI